VGDGLAVLFLGISGWALFLF